MKKFLLALICSLLLSTPVFAAFEDVPSSHEHYKGVSYLELIGAVDPANTFRPDDFITQGEYFKILFKTLGAETNDLENPFDNVPNEAWFAPYAILAQENRLIHGNHFLVDAPLTRGNALQIAMKAYGLSQPIVPKSVRTPLFKDIGSSHPFYTLLFQAVSLNLFEGDLTEKYRPYERMTRGEFADLIYALEIWKNEKAVEASPADFYKSDIMTDIWNRILTDFYTPKGYEIDQDVLFETAIKAILSSLKDPYSVYFTSAEASEFTDSIEGEFEGVGLMLTQDEDLNVIITDILANSPAASSPLEAGDQIVKVDDVSIEGMALEEVIGRIKGRAGTEVKLGILREGKTYSYALTRAAIKLDLVEGSLYQDDKWFITIHSFAINIYEETIETLDDLTKQEANPSAIIIDLRGNPGGYVNMANFIAGMFVPQLTPLVTLDYGGYAETIYNGDIGQYQDVPVYILMDAYSASASEILAQTLKEEANATIIGTQSFGKGTAQELITYWDGSMLKLTIAEWLSAEGTSIQSVGVTPNIEVNPEEDVKDPWLKALNAALKADL